MHPSISAGTNPGPHSSAMATRVAMAGVCSSAFAVRFISIGALRHRHRRGLGLDLDCGCAACGFGRRGVGFLLLSAQRQRPARFTRSDERESSPRLRQNPRRGVGRIRCACRIRGCGPISEPPLAATRPCVVLARSSSRSCQGAGVDQKVCRRRRQRRHRSSVRARRDACENPPHGRW